MKEKRSDEVVLQIILNDGHKDAAKTFAYIMTTDRLRMIIWNDNSNQTGMVKPRFKDPTFPLPAMALQ